MAQRDLLVRILGDSRSLQRAFLSSSKGARNFERDMGRATRGALAGSGALSGLGKSLAFASGGFITFASIAGSIRAAFTELNESRRVTAQTNAAIKSTGAIAGVTAKHVEELGDALLRKTGIDDEAIRSSENLLLTFTNVRNVIGDGNNVFDQATTAILDMSTAMGGDLEGATIRVGKALQDPIRGATALRRVGVQLTESQERQIKAFVRTGRVLDAQKIILRELTREFGGSAAAAGNVQPWNLLRETVLNLSADLAEKFLPKIQEVTTRLQHWLDNPQNVDKVTQDVGKVSGAFGSLVDHLIDFNNKGNQAMEDLRTGLKAGSEAGRLALLSPFEKLGGPIGDWARRERAESLAELEALRRGAVAIAVDMRRELTEALQIKNRASAAPEGTTRAPGAAGATTGGITVTQRNRFFDNDLARALDRVQDSELRAQIEKLQSIEARISQRIAVTKDITRKLNLEDQLLDVRRRIKSIRVTIAEDLRSAASDARTALEDAGQALIDALQFGLTKAQVTASFADDLAALDAINAGLRQRIAAEGETLDLQRQLFENQQAIVEAQRSQRNARQFKSLGLTATGGEKIPGLTSLRRQLGNVSDAVKGTFLDTGKTQSLMKSIRKILAGGMGAVSEDVRSTIRDMLRDINQQLQDTQRRFTKGRALSADSVLAGLGLPRDVEKVLRARLSHVGAGGRVLAGASGPGAFGFPIGGGGGINVNGPITVVASNPDAFIRELQKKARRVATQTTGAHAGNASGFVR